jgi:CRP/FNR family transcriptional regulator
MHAAAAQFHVFNSEGLCSSCPSRALAFCRGAVGAAQKRPLDRSPLKALEQTVNARRTMFRQGESLDTVPVICKGWAASRVMLKNGRHQILSFLLPGDVISAALIFGPTIQTSIDSITEVQFRSFSRDELKRLFVSSPEVFDTYARAWLDEKSRTDQLAVDLGQRPAEERISRLILNLFERLDRIGLTRDDTMDFPLRHRHISNYAGITPVHVSRVFAEFRSKKLVDISERTMTIKNLPALRRLADM